MKKKLPGLVAAAGLLFFSSCSQDPPLISLGMDDVYYLPRMTAYTLRPAFYGESYRWTLKTASGKDSLLATGHTYTFLAAAEGTYQMTLEIMDPEFPYTHEFSVVVSHEEVEYSPYISRVYEYRPAPGQFVNQMPLYEEGDTEADMCRKAEECLTRTNDELVSLGGYGGYITFGFDHTVVNVRGEKDFMILGNAIYESNGSTVTGASAEPGIVMVAFDTNQNGLPDPEEWFELAGSEYDKPTTVKNYEITYSRPDPDKIPVPAPGLVDSEYIAWTDNQGSTGFMAQNRTHTQDYYPRWIPEDRMVFSGTLLPTNAVLQSGTYFLYPYEWGYVDNRPNVDEESNHFDIDWAVNKEGKPVSLPGVDFVRVYTGMNQSCGWVGETSTEIVRARDLHLN